MKYFLDKKTNHIHWADCSRFNAGLSAVYLGAFEEGDGAALREGRRLSARAQPCSGCMPEVAEII